jgi:uncharacterized protein HemY
MKTGPAILVLIGIVLVAAFMLMPRTPDLAKEEKSATDHIHETVKSTLSTADSLVDEALRKLESGELPPMQAVLSIRDVAERFPENIKANFTLGVMSMQTGQYSKAMDRFKKVLSEDLQNVDAHLLLARAYVSVGDTIQAVSGLEEALNSLSDDQMKIAIRKELASINSN